MQADSHGNFDTALMVQKQAETTLRRACEGNEKSRFSVFFQPAHKTISSLDAILVMSIANQTRYILRNALCFRLTSRREREQAGGCSGEMRWRVKVFLIREEKRKGTRR